MIAEHLCALTAAELDKDTAQVPKPALARGGWYSYTGRQDWCAARRPDCAVGFATKLLAAERLGVQCTSAARGSQRNLGAPNDGAPWLERRALSRERTFLGL